MVVEFVYNLTNPIYSKQKHATNLVNATVPRKINNVYLRCITLTHRNN